MTAKSNEGGALPRAPRTPEGWAVALREACAAALERWADDQTPYNIDAVTAEHFRAAIAERDAEWRKAYRGSHLNSLSSVCADLRDLVSGTARNASGRPPDNELSNQVRRDNGED